MNVLLNFIIIFLFIIFVLAMKIPKLVKSNIIINKIYLFIGVSLLQIVVLLSNKINQKCKISTKNIIKEATKIGLLTVIGYSFYVDILFSSQLREKYAKYIDVPNKNMFFVATLISGTAMVYKIIDNILLPNDCTP